MPDENEPTDGSNTEETSERSTSERVFDQLATNDDRAFEPAEIAARTGIDEDVVGSALTGLKRRSLVEREGTAWAITSDRARLERHHGYARATRVFNGQLGTENRDEWAEHVPDNPHPNARRSR